jgi:hypothetical protein
MIELNIGKSGILPIGMEPGEKFVVNGQEIDWLLEIKYLGFYFDRTG